MGNHETHNHHRHCDRRSWPRSLWIDSRSEGNPDPRADGRFNPCPDRNARADSITHACAASAAGGDRRAEFRDCCATQPGR